MKAESIDEMGIVFCNHFIFQTCAVKSSQNNFLETPNYMGLNMLYVCNQGKVYKCNAQGKEYLGTWERSNHLNISDTKETIETSRPRRLFNQVILVNLMVLVILCSETTKTSEPS